MPQEGVGGTTRTSLVDCDDIRHLLRVNVALLVLCPLVVAALIATDVLPERVATHWDEGRPGTGVTQLALLLTVVAGAIACAVFGTHRMRTRHSLSAAREMFGAWGLLRGIVVAVVVADAGRSSADVTALQGSELLLIGLSPLLGALAGHKIGRSKGPT